MNSAEVISLIGKNDVVTDSVPLHSLPKFNPGWQFLIPTEGPSNAILMTLLNFKLSTWITHVDI